MRIGIAYDMHGKPVSKENLKDVDIVLVNGDFSRADLAREYWKQYTLTNKEVPAKKKKEAEKEISESARKFLESFEKKPLYFIHGNVEKPRHLNFKLRRNVHDLNQKIVKIDDLTIAGVRYVREKWWIDKFSLGTYKSDEKEVKDFLSKLEKVDILLAHNPPYGYLDVNDNPSTPQLRGKHHGSKLVLDYIKRKQPKYVLCGHIHEGKGRVKIGKTTIINGGLQNFEVLDL